MTKKLSPAAIRAINARRVAKRTAQPTKTGSAMLAACLAASGHADHSAR